MMLPLNLGNPQNSETHSPLDGILGGCSGCISHGLDPGRVNPWHLAPLTLPLLPQGPAVYSPGSSSPDPCTLHGSQTHCVPSVQQSEPQGGGAERVPKRDLEQRPDSSISLGRSANSQLLTSPSLSLLDPSQIPHSFPTLLPRALPFYPGCLQEPPHPPP